MGLFGAVGLGGTEMSTTAQPLNFFLNILYFVPHPEEFLEPIFYFPNLLFNCVHPAVFPLLFQQVYFQVSTFELFSCSQSFLSHE